MTKIEKLEKQIKAAHEEIKKFTETRDRFAQEKLGVMSRLHEQIAILTAPLSSAGYEARYLAVVTSLAAKEVTRARLLVTRFVLDEGGVDPKFSRELNKLLPPKRKYRKHRPKKP